MPRWRGAATAWCGCAPVNSTARPPTGTGSKPREPMSIALEHKPVNALALRYALRELRGGLRGFYVFIACIALGVMAIAGVGSVAASLSEGLTREGRTLLGGDIAFSLIQREAKPEEVAFLRARGQLSVAAALRV